MASVKDRLADRGILETISRDVVRESTRNRAPDTGGRFLRRDRTNASIYDSILSEYPGLSKYERSIVRNEIDAARTARNTITRTETRAREAQATGTAPPAVRFRVTVVLTEQDSAGNTRTSIHYLDDLSSTSNAEIMDRLERNAASNPDGRYDGISARTSGAGGRGRAGDNAGIGGWTPVSFTRIDTQIQ